MTTKVEKMKVPQKALLFNEAVDNSFEFFEKEGEDLSFKMRAYGGGLIKNHWWWGDLAIDTDGIQLPKGRFPILEAHDTDKKVGFADEARIENHQVLIGPEKFSFVDTPESRAFQKLSRQGFPYQASMSVRPTNIERLEEGATAKVNGFTMKGPGTIFRKCTLQESSVCVFGYDSNTKSTAFSAEMDLDVETLLSDDGKEQLQIKEKEVGKVMDLAQLKKDHPDVCSQFEAEIKGQMKTQFSKETETLSAEITALKAENEKKEERVLALEKDAEIRKIGDLAKQAGDIWLSKLSASDIPEHLFSKVQKHVNHSKFVKDGVLDVESFSKAIDTEIKDWVDKGVVSSVMGAGFAQKDETAQAAATKFAADKKETEDTTNALLARVGQRQENK